MATALELAGRWSFQVYLGEEAASDPARVAQDPRASAGSIFMHAHGRQEFRELAAGDELTVTLAGGERQCYRVSELHRFQWLDFVRPGQTEYEPDSPFLNLTDGSAWTAFDVLRFFYRRPGRLVLCTCIAQGDNPSWGLLFVASVEVE